VPIMGTILISCIFMGSAMLLGSWPPPVSGGQRGVGVRRAAYPTQGGMPVFKDDTAVAPRALRGLGAGASPNASLARVRIPFSGWFR
jgi:hypothetical protein